MLLARDQIPDDLMEYFEPAGCGECYVCRLVEVFRETRRVLRSDGTVWLNLGDSYAGSWGAQGRGDTTTGFNERWSGGRWNAEGKQAQIHSQKPNLSEGQIAAHPKGQRKTGSLERTPGLKSKDLVGIPWRVAFALQADGWWLRSDIIWAKPNPMPESVTDRPTRAHEYLFLLTKSARYFYDADAIREEHSEAMGGWKSYQPRGLIVHGDGETSQVDSRAGVGANPAGRNRRSVWEIATQPYPDAHFATFPPKLVEPCILAGSPPKCCGECGAPWERVVEVIEDDENLKRFDGFRPRWDTTYETEKSQDEGNPHERPASAMFADTLRKERKTRGWRPTCNCDADVGGGSAAPERGPAAADVSVERSVVLDPFCGSGTTGVVALRHDRSFVGIELSADYCELARNRIRDDAPLLNSGIEVAA